MVPLAIGVDAAHTDPTDVNTAGLSRRRIIARYVNHAVVTTDKLSAGSAPGEGRVVCDQ